MLLYEIEDSLKLLKCSESALKHEVVRELYSDLSSCEDFLFSYNLKLLHLLVLEVLLLLLFL